ncbi:uncharacterized protein LOC126837287 isoform X2 [Adelges cooleyi]|nr:uncharacterized protein LOC126837287 isoform X2 [Adelges cooleyi]
MSQHNDKFKSKLRSSEFVRRSREGLTLPPDFNSHTTTPPLVFCSDKPMYRGRGLVIQQLSMQPPTDSENLLNNPNLDYSNSSIEEHFKNIREENAKKNAEENQRKFGHLITKGFKK